MITRLQLSLGFILAAAALAAPATQPIFQETFDGKLGEGWSWLREDASAWSAKDHALHLRVSTGSLWEKANSAKNVLLRDLPADQRNIVAQVTITSLPKDQAEQATMLFYVDEDNYVKLCKEMMTGKQNVVLAREEAGKGKFIAGKPSDAQTLTMRLTRHGDEIIGEYSTDGASWTEVGKCPIPAGKDFKIGLVAHGANSGDPREAECKQFRVDRLSE